MAILKICLLCLIFVLAAGCGKTPEQTTTEKKIEESTGVDTKVAVQKNEITITGERKGGDTTSSDEVAEIPKDFPADMYIYRPSRIVTAMGMPEGGALVLTTSDDVSTVAEAYKREMTARSWSEQSAVKNGERLMLVYEKEERIADITIGSMEGVAQIMLTVTKQ